MTVRSYLHTNADAIIACLGELRPRTVILDVEPLVAYWNTGEAALDAGISRWTELVSAPPQVEALVFATNSHRRPTTQITLPGVRYVATAFKPFRTSLFHDLPRPGVLIGDQLATDGLLAWRLGYTFIHYRPQHHRTPIGVHLMHALGIPFRPFLFHKR